MHLNVTILYFEFVLAVIWLGNMYNLFTRKFKQSFPVSLHTVWSMCQKNENMIKHFLFQRYSSYKKDFFLEPLPT